MFRNYTLGNNTFRGVYGNINLPEDKRISLFPSAEEMRNERKLLSASKFKKADGEKGKYIIYT